MTLRISLPSAALGAAALGLALLAASAAAPQSVATALTTLLRVKVISPVEIVGMPAAEDIVNFDTLTVSPEPDGALNFPPGASIPIYTVPITHRLVITAWRAAGGGNIALYQDLGGVLTGKINPQNIVIPGVPIVFEPGSQAVLVNVSTTNAAVIYVTASGYLEEL